MQSKPNQNKKKSQMNEKSSLGCFSLLMNNNAIYNTAHASTVKQYAIFKLVQYADYPS